MAKKAATSKKRVTDEAILDLIDKKLDAKQICEKCGFSKGTLRRKLFELSIARGQLITVAGLFGASTRTEFEIKKSGSLVIPAKALESQGYTAGARFKIVFEDKQLVLNLI